MISSCPREQSFLKMKLSQTCGGQIRPGLSHKSFFKEHRADAALHRAASAEAADVFGGPRGLCGSALK